MGFCFVLIEWYLNGCDAQMRISGVTLDQQYAYTWLRATTDEFIQRETRQVPFIEP